MFKRPLDIYDSSPASSTPPRLPVKRRRFSPSLTASSPSPYASIYAPYSTPSDSPTNPFGRFRSHILSLPDPTSFSKHLPLRFQLVRRGEKRGEGSYRIVQVPLNYTFKLLMKLVLFLFGGHPKVNYGGPTATKKRIGKTEKDDGETESIFEIQKRIVMHREAYKPGQIRCAKTWAKVSSSRDELDEDYDEVTRQWRWRSEDDFTLGHVWPKGGDLERGITYHHNKNTQIHITVNTQTLPKRSGVSNQPYVFHGRGIVYLRPNTPPAMLFSTLDGRDMEEVEEKDEALTYPLHPAPSDWNTGGVFNKYLKRTCKVDRDRLSSSEPCHTPEEDGDFNISASTLPNFECSPLISAQSTPYPSNSSAQQLKRVEHASRRIIRLARLVRATESDEEEVEVEAEVDELAEDVGV